MLSKPIAAIAALLISLAISGCARQSNALRPQTLPPPAPVANTAACPNGQIRVCDRRRPIGCQCRSQRHIRAIIGG